MNFQLFGGSLGFFHDRLHAAILPAQHAAKSARIRIDDG
jgi:hypothetical protein